MFFFFRDASRIFQILSEIHLELLNGIPNSSSVGSRNFPKDSSKNYSVDSFRIYFIFSQAFFQNFLLSFFPRVLSRLLTEILSGNYSRVSPGIPLGLGILYMKSMFAFSYLSIINFYRNFPRIPLQVGFIYEFLEASSWDSFRNSLLYFNRNIFCLRTRLIETKDGRLVIR